MHTCDTCHCSFNRKQNYDRHLDSRKHKLREQPSTQLHECLRCNKTFSFASGLFKHKKDCDKILESKIVELQQVVEEQREKLEKKVSNNEMESKIAELEQIIEEERENHQKEVGKLRNQLEELPKQHYIVQYGRQKLKPKVREDVVAKQDNKCNMCHAKMSKYFNIDHIVALQYGGTNEIDNLQALCCECHMKKSVLENKARGRIKEAILTIMKEQAETC